MKSIREQLDAEIAIWQSEVDRLAAVVKVEYPAAQARLESLLKLATDLTPDFEDLAARLKDAALTVPINDPSAVKKEQPVTRAMQVSTAMPALNVPMKGKPKKGKKR